MYFNNDTFAMKLSSYKMYSVYKQFSQWVVVDTSFFPNDFVTIGNFE